MKALSTFYVVLSTAYFSILVVLAVVAFVQGRYEDVLICLLSAFVAVAFGFLTARLLEVYPYGKSKNEG